MDISATNLFLTLILGMGPTKALVFFLAETDGMPRPAQRKVAFVSCLSAGGVAIVLLLFGAFAQQLMHFSEDALRITGGVVLSILAINIVLRDTPKKHEGDGDMDPLELAVHPLAIPLILNPIGVVSLITFSAEAQSVHQYFIIATGIGVMTLVDLILFLAVSRALPRIPHALADLIERVLSLLVAAMAMQLILDGVKNTGIFSGG